MKLIIVEGPDNCGKDTLINKLQNKFLSITNIHYVMPNNKYLQFPIFRGYAYSIIDKKYNTDAIILNRSHYGEYVYGCIYRNMKDKEILDLIDEIDQLYIDNNIDAYYIQLMSSSTKLLVNNDDKLSISRAMDKLINKELERFKFIYDYSPLNKKMIYVNDGDNFRDVNEIFNEVCKFLNI